MIFRAPQTMVDECVSTASSITSGKTQMNILANILLESDGGRVVVTATDLEVGIRTAFEAETERPGSITVNGKKLQEIVKQLPADSDIVFDVGENNEIRIKSGNSSVKAKYTLKGIPKENFPAVPSIGENQPILTVPQKELREMIKKTIFSISEEPSRQFLNGVYFETDNGILRLVSTDGRRLSLIERNFGVDAAMAIRSIVPKKILNEVSRKLLDEGNVDMSLTENQIFFRFNGMDYTSTLISGSFPNYNQVIPKKQDRFVGISRKSFQDVLGRSHLLVSNAFNQLKMDFSDNHLVVSINNNDLGTYKEEMDIDYKGEPIEVAFNHGFLRDYFDKVSSDDVAMEMNTPLSPVSFKTASDPEYLYIVMPMKAT